MSYDQPEGKERIWKPITFEHLLSGHSLREPRVWILLAGWVVAITLALTATVVLLPKEWITLEGSRIDIINFFLFNPALMLGMLLFFWFGFEWGFIPIFLSSFIIAFHSHMPWGWSLVFGISFVLGLAICGMAYQGFRIAYDLRSIKSVVFYVFISFIASIGSSMGAFIWSFTHQLSAFDTLTIWKSWWSGTFLQSIIVVGPVLLIATPFVERFKAKWFQMPSPEKVSVKWIFGSVVSISAALALFILSGKMLGQLRVREVMTASDMATVSDVLSALESFEIISWISIVIIIITGYGAITLISGWNRQLSKEVDKRTDQLNESQKELEKSLEEKKVLLKEVHHRVKNNMALVSALLELQQKFHGSDMEGDPKVLQVARSRIRSMAMAHEALYHNETFSELELADYIKKISELTLQSFSKPDTLVALKYDLEEAYIEMSKSIPLGLLVNEILINAFKHAFTDKKEGTIWIENRLEDGKSILTIRDDGNGIPDQDDIMKKATLGMKLIRKLSKQLRGELTIDSKAGEGATFRLVFEH